MGSERLSDDALADLRRLLEQGTPGPWRAAINPHRLAVEAQKEAASVYGPDCLIYRVARDYVCLLETWERQRSDAALIVAAVNALPALLEEIAQGREKMAPKPRHQPRPRESYPGHTRHDYAFHTTDWRCDQCNYPLSDPLACPRCDTLPRTNKFGNNIFEGEGGSGVRSSSTGQLAPCEQGGMSDSADDPPISGYISTGLVFGLALLCAVVLFLATSVPLRAIAKIREVGQHEHTKLDIVRAAARGVVETKEIVQLGLTRRQDCDGVCAWPKRRVVVSQCDVQASTSLKIVCVVDRRSWAQKFPAAFGGPVFQVLRHRPFREFFEEEHAGFDGYPVGASLSVVTHVDKKSWQAESDSDWTLDSWGAESQFGAHLFGRNIGALLGRDGLPNSPSSRQQTEDGRKNRDSKGPIGAALIALSVGAYLLYLGLQGLIFGLGGKKRWIQLLLGLLVSALAAFALVGFVVSLFSHGGLQR